MKLTGNYSFGEPVIRGLCLASETRLPLLLGKLLKKLASLRSWARSLHGSQHPDLARTSLAVVLRLMEV